MREYPAELTATLHPAEEALACYVLDLMSIVGLEDGQVMGFFARLADLIEPEPERTCRMRDTRWDDGQCTWGCICSECGAKHEHKSGRWFNFCPNCGAKVVEE